MNLPLISVILPTYNRAEILLRAIKSIIDQTYTNFELIIVDDASSDDTCNVVKSISDTRIKYIKHDKNKGGAASRNTGIKAAKGSLIAFLDDDDEWMSAKLEKQVVKFKNVSEKVGLIYCGTQIIEGEKVITTYYPTERGDLRKRLLMGTTIGGTDPALVKKECFDKVGLFDEQLTSCQDWDMWKRVSEKYQFDFVPEVLVKLYAHKHQISTNLASMIPGRTRMVHKYQAEFSLYPEIYVVHLKRLGKLHAINGTWKEAFSWFAKAVKVRFLEVFKIAIWLMIEYPGVKLLSKAKKFKKYKLKEKLGNI